MKNVLNVKGFHVLETVGEAQTAVMTLEAGESSGPKMNEHAQSEQVLYVVTGEVDAEIGDGKFRMKSGDSVIVPKHVSHRFTNAGKDVAVTFNVYTPPAY